MASYTANQPINNEAEKVLLHLGATIDGQTIIHEDIHVGTTETWAGDWRGRWVTVPQITIQDVEFMDDSQYESFRLCTEAGVALAKSL